MLNIYYWGLIFILIAIILVYIYWRFFFFFRDPERKIPKGENIVSPADGTVVYVKKTDTDEVPISIKNKKQIKLEEIFKYKISPLGPSYLIGVFMHPTSVHVNRAPIEGIVEKIHYSPNKNKPMTMMWWRVLLGIKPYESYSSHVIENERNMILFRGIIPVYIVQIADIFVNKIECWVKENQSVQKGQRVGMIKMGSQVDVYFPASNISEVVVKAGQKVFAGETILASLK